MGYCPVVRASDSKLRGPRQLRPKEIDGLLVSTGKASTLLTDHLSTG